MTDEDHRTWLVVAEELRHDLEESMKADNGILRAQQIYDALFPEGRPVLRKAGQAHGTINIKKKKKKG